MKTEIKFTLALFNQSQTLFNPVFSTRSNSHLGTIKDIQMKLQKKTFSFVVCIFFLEASKLCHRYKHVYYNLRTI